jgi:hypothetical protein
MLRIYADKTALNSRKIPYLSKAMIFKLIKLVGRNKSVSIYINDINGTCEFEENGDITFYSEFEQIVDEVEIEQLLRDKLNPDLEIIKSYFEQNGYSMSLFDTLKHKNIEIKHLQYQSVVRINNALDIKKLRGCVSNIFIIESDDIAKGLVMRFKRVANFNKMSSMEAFVIEQQKDGLRDVEIIDALLENYKDLSEKDAVMLLGKMASELQIERGANKSIAEIKVNPGFKCNSLGFPGSGYKELDVVSTRLQCPALNCSTQVMPCAAGMPPESFWVLAPIRWGYRAHVNSPDIVKLPIKIEEDIPLLIFVGRTIV